MGAGGPERRGGASPRGDLHIDHPDHSREGVVEEGAPNDVAQVQNYPRTSRGFIRLATAAPIRSIVAPK